MNVLVVAAHPDDEVLGCGGTIAQLVKAGDEVNVLLMGDGAGFPIERESRRDEANKVREIIGYQGIIFRGFPDQQLDRISLLSIIQAIETSVTRYMPDVVYTHHWGDLNLDHELVSRAVITATRPQPGCPVKEVYTFEILSSTSWSFQKNRVFVPNVYVDISKTLDKKLEAFDCYTSEKREWPHERSHEAIKVLAARRGCEVGLESAEAFHLVRSVRY